MKRVYVIALFLLTGFLTAQDIHYSQFDRTTTLINPSLIANQQNDYELQLQRRSQWASVTVPFNTFSFSVNAKHIYKKLSLAGTFINDVAGDSRFLTNGTTFSLANSFIANSNFLSLGLQIGFYQRSVNYDDLIFLEEENFNNKALSFFDFGVGFSNQKTVNNNSYLIIGVSGYHLNKPQQSLLSSDDVFLHPKYVLHFSYHNSLESKIDVYPQCYFSSQNQDKEFIIGSGIKYKLNEDFSLKSALYSRLNDAVIVILGMQKSNFEAIISYDVNTSSLVNASNSMGAVEFSISYKWNMFNDLNDYIEIKEKICPTYL